MKTLLALLLLIPSLSWGLTFKGGEVVNKSTNSNDDSNKTAANNKKYEQKYLDPNYVFKSDEKVIWPNGFGDWGKTFKVHDRIHPNSWALRFDDEFLRVEDYSLRFEKREKDCHPDDCNRTSANYIGRSEISIKEITNSTYGELGNKWYTWSFYIPEESQLPGDDGNYSLGFVIMGQFKTPTNHQYLTREYLGIPGIVNGPSSEEKCPELSLNFQLKQSGLVVDRKGTKFCKSGKSFYVNLVKPDDLKGKWHDIIINANWTDSEDEGFIMLWVNGEMKLLHEGKTISKLLKIDNTIHGPTLRIGVYSQRWNGTSIVYYNNIKRSDTCKNLKVNLLNLSCEGLRSEIEKKKNESNSLLDELDFAIQ